MSSLATDIQILCYHNRDGAYGTQAKRRYDLALVARELTAFGFRLTSARSLKPKHIERLLNHWQQQNLDPRTIKNRMSSLRWLTKRVGKDGMINPKNEHYGIVSVASQQDRAKPLDREKLEQIDDAYVRMSLELQAAFGLRREESIKIVPSLADCGGFIRLEGSWCKGGRVREVPITHPKQREIINKAKGLAKGGALIPSVDSYKTQLKRYDYQTLKVGMLNNHGHRYAWAQWRYKQLTGFACPYAGGKPKNALKGAEKKADAIARQKLTREMGHERPDITNVYLGL